MQVAPRDLTLAYYGLVAIHDGRHAPRLYGTEFTLEEVVVIGDETAGPTADVVRAVEPGGFISYEEAHPLGEPLHWAVGDEDMIGLFTFWISTQRTKQTVAKCSIEGRQLFVNVDLVKGGQSVDARLPELGGLSVREVLKHIEKPGPKPRAPERFKPPLRR